MQARHDGADRTLHLARDLAIAQVLDVGELEDAAFGGSELRQRRAQRGFVDGAARLGRLGLGHDRERDHARAQPLVAAAAAALADGEVGEDAAQPGAPVGARLIAVARRQRAHEGLLDQIVGVAAAQAPREAA
jgi:hypothetical protein